MKEGFRIHAPITMEKSLEKGPNTLEYTNYDTAFISRFDTPWAGGFSALLGQLLGFDIQTGKPVELDIPLQEELLRSIATPEQGQSYLKNVNRSIGNLTRMMAETAQQAKNLIGAMREMYKNGWKDRNPHEWIRVHNLAAMIHWVSLTKTINLENAATTKVFETAREITTQRQREKIFQDIFKLDISQKIRAEEEQKQSLELPQE
jgi:hypothetical protein